MLALCFIGQPTGRLGMGGKPAASRCGWTQSISPSATDSCVTAVGSKWCSCCRYVSGSIIVFATVSTFTFVGDAMSVSGVCARGWRQCRGFPQVAVCFLLLQRWLCCGRQVSASIGTRSVWACFSSSCHSHRCAGVVCSAVSSFCAASFLRRMTTTQPPLPRRLFHSPRRAQLPAVLYVVCTRPIRAQGVGW